MVARFIGLFGGGFSTQVFFPPRVPFSFAQLCALLVTDGQFMDELAFVY
jgi:hypothetical protein